MRIAAGPRATIKLVLQLPAAPSASAVDLSGGSPAQAGAGASIADRNPSRFTPSLHQYRGHRFARVAIVAETRGGPGRRPTPTRGSRPRDRPPLPRPPQATGFPEPLGNAQACLSGRRSRLSRPPARASPGRAQAASAAREPTRRAAAGSASPMQPVGLMRRRVGNRQHQRCASRLAKPRNHRRRPGPATTGRPPLRQGVRPPERGATGQRSGRPPLRSPNSITKLATNTPTRAHGSASLTSLPISGASPRAKRYYPRLPHLRQGGLAPAFGQAASRLLRLRRRG